VRKEEGERRERGGREGGERRERGGLREWGRSREEMR
jgi:hypothetical protein